MSVHPRAIELLVERKKAYQSLHEVGMADLAKFCRANETCFDPDPRIHAVLEGRREVYLRIKNHRDLSPEELAVLYKAIELSDEGL